MRLVRKDFPSRGFVRRSSLQMCSGKGVQGRERGEVGLAGFVFTISFRLFVRSKSGDDPAEAKIESLQAEQANRSG